MKIGYAIISTRDQNPDLQIDALKNAGCEDIYTEVASGGKSERPKLDEMLANLRKSNRVSINSVVRFAACRSPFPSSKSDSQRLTAMGWLQVRQFISSGLAG